jgi:putative exosortase-associated protein (TIGR04073 family)
MAIVLSRSSRLLAACVALGTLAWPSTSFADPAGERAGRGVAAMVAPFLEIPGNIVRTTRLEGATKAWTEGLARGIGMSIIRPPVGVYELVTAPFPQLADDPPLLTPTYPWSYFESQGSGDSNVARGSALPRD